ncbi:MAG TPA: phosphate ABC transporter ATP-binding protein PstB [Spirochaetota bacterium]|nr:phosphate ABC transporter ATP-binding protein PstB [Spirochaetota bacterium]
MDEKQKNGSVENLNLWFDKNHVLKDITFPVYQNELTSIIGPSGCGKSTLLRCFNRMNDYIEKTKIDGKIIIDRHNINAPGTDIYNLRTKVGMVFQKPNPFPKTIYENVAFGLKIKGEKKNLVREKVEKSLKDANLWSEVSDRLHSSALSLSGGQQQRLCIARALANEPEILLLDEATSALDPKSTNKIEELLHNLKKNVTILAVTHNIGQAGRISDYTAFLYLGELIEFKNTSKLFTAPDDKRTERYLEGKFG